MTDAARKPIFNKDKINYYIERGKAFLRPAIEKLRTISGDKIPPVVMMVGAVVLALAGLTLLGADWMPLPNPNYRAITDYSPIQSIRIYDKNGNQACVIPGSEDRVFVPLDKISPNMTKAIMAAEDHTFYSHGGISPVGIFRAALTNLQAGHVKEGGSTITQQLVKNLYLKNEPRNIFRKIKEAWMAWQVERHCTKKQIMQAYLNEVYFGNGVYGVERASQRYFNKPSSKLSVAEAAYIASLVKAPSEMSSVANRKVAFARQNEIIDAMVEQKFVTAKEGAAAKKQKLAFYREPRNFERYPFYTATVYEQLRQQTPEDQLFTKGLKVYTALDQQAQQAGEKTMAAGISKAPRGVRQGALVSMSVKDAGVIALVGGVGDYWKHQWNRATSYHTAGSSFKPFVYLTGLIKGTIGPNSIVEDEPVTIFQKGSAPYTPRNFDGKFKGPLSIRKALAFSRNVCSVRIAASVGIKSVIETARAAGITSRLDPYPALALGCSAVSPIEMAGAYGTFARSGTYIKPWVISRVVDMNGNQLYEHKIEKKKVFPDEPVNQLVDMMQDVVNKGTGTMARLPGRPVAGKTGTADQAKDIWFVGFTPDVVTATWGGNDENKRIPGSSVTGGGVMAKMWHDYSSQYYKAHKVPVIAFAKPQHPINDVQPTYAYVDENEDSTVASAPDSSVKTWNTYIVKRVQPAPRHTEAAVVERPRRTEPAVEQQPVIIEPTKNAAPVQEYVEEEVIQETTQPIVHRVKKFLKDL